MNEIQKLGAADIFLAHAGKIDPLFGLAERRWHLAKSHVAKGHESERSRLMDKGRGYGAGLGAAAGMTAGLAGGWKGSVIGGAVAAGLGAILGREAGSWEAGQRLRLSQARGAKGHYAPLHPKLASAAFGGLSAMAPAVNTVLGSTARASRAQIRGTKRARVKPLEHKPMVVNTPAPQQPRVEPTTITPTQAPAKLAAHDSRPSSNPITRRVRRMRDETSAGEPATGGRVMRPGEKMPGANRPVTHTNRKPHDF